MQSARSRHAPIDAPFAPSWDHGKRGKAVLNLFLNEPGTLESSTDSGVLSTHEDTTPGASTHVLDSDHRRNRSDVPGTASERVGGCLPSRRKKARGSVIRHLSGQDGQAPDALWLLAHPDDQRGRPVCGCERLLDDLLNVAAVLKVSDCELRALGRAPRGRLYIPDTTTCRAHRGRNRTRGSLPAHLSPCLALLGRPCTAGAWWARYRLRWWWTETEQRRPGPCPAAGQRSCTESKRVGMSDFIMPSLAIITRGRVHTPPDSLVPIDFRQLQAFSTYGRLDLEVVRRSLRSRAGTALRASSAFPSLVLLAPPSSTTACSASPPQVRAMRPRQGLCGIDASDRVSDFD